MNFVDVLKNIPIVGYVFFGLFLVASIIQVALAALDKDELRRKEKTFCLLFLMVFVIVTIPTKPILYIAVFFSMLGDLLLVSKKKMPFYIGSFSFAASHILYLVSLILIVGNHLQWWIYLIAFVVAVLFYLASTNLIAKRLTQNKFEQYTMMGYFSILFFNFLVMILSTTAIPLYLFITAIGGFMFVISDSILVYNKFYKPIKKAEVLVMSTYLIAQALIVIGMLLTIITLN
ncbi:MAG: lysoplasmalogenase [Bacilli bacterium]|nr:lysoplasmalogenase [Bacilli bacterium]